MTPLSVAEATSGTDLQRSSANHVGDILCQFVSERRWHWVKGHAGHDENERADQLARDGVAMARLKG